MRSGEKKDSDDLFAFIPKTVGEGIKLDYTILSADGDPSKGSLNFRFVIDETLPADPEEDQEWDNADDEEAEYD